MLVFAPGDALELMVHLGETQYAFVYYMIFKYVHVIHIHCKIVNSVWGVCLERFIRQLWSCVWSLGHESINNPVRVDIKRKEGQECNIRNKKEIFSL